MFRLTLRNISRQKLRYALTTLAVVLGVSFLSTAFFLTDRIRDTFDELAVEITGGLDLEVRTAIGDGDRINRLPVPDELTEVITTEIPGVAAVEPRIRAFNVIPIYLDDTGEPAAVSSNGPEFGMNFCTQDNDVAKIAQLREQREMLWAMSKATQAPRPDDQIIVMLGLFRVRPIMGAPVGSMDVVARLAEYILLAVFR
ncbi:MAG: hypothetical protein QF739_11590, partial [Acidimicrobiales bacterium]|nr:hypothetical protein [Acidimicrobiales bacterium]